MTGAITMGTNDITRTTDPPVANSVTRRSWVESNVLGAENRLNQRIDGVQTTAEQAYSWREPTITPGTTTQYWRGDKTWRAFATDVLATTLNNVAILAGNIAVGDSVTNAFRKLQARVNERLPLSGGTMTGAITMGANNITSTRTPTADNDLTRKGYVDAQDASWAAGRQSTLISGQNIRTVGGVDILGSGDIPFPEGLPVPSPVNQQLFVSGANNLIYGTGNVVRGNNNVVHGNDNIINGNNLTVHGNNRYIGRDIPAHPSSAWIDIGTSWDCTRNAIILAQNDINLVPDGVDFAVNDDMVISATWSGHDGSWNQSWSDTIPRQVVRITQILNHQTIFGTWGNSLLCRLLVINDSINTPIPLWVDESTVEVRVEIHGMVNTRWNWTDTLNARPILFNPQNFVSHTSENPRNRQSFSTSFNNGFVEDGSHSAAMNSGAVRFGANAMAVNRGFVGGNLGFAANSGEIYTVTRDVNSINWNNDTKRFTVVLPTTLPTNALAVGNRVRLRYRVAANDTAIRISNCRVITWTSGTRTAILVAEIDPWFSSMALFAPADGIALLLENGLLAWGPGSFVFGQGVAIGDQNQAAGGQRTIARHQNAFIVGRFGVSPEAHSFSVANGTHEGNPSLAFSVRPNGNAQLMGTLSQNTAADYAEMFEWLDGNLQNEDRVGRFVTLEGNKIRPATSKDDYILGVISGMPSVLGDSGCLHWVHKYLRDDFGRIITHDVEISEEREYFDEEDVILQPELWPVERISEFAFEEVIPTRSSENVDVKALERRPKERARKYKVIREACVERQLKLNPEWDSSMDYIPREERPEWAPVGMLGQLWVISDGTCEVNGFCMPGTDGIATSSKTGGYRVVQKNDKLVKIIFR
ncbi:MAG: hypothetical protein FWE04_01545 [Oscillospiraceae bacterium]|nr:hypothetical protein [Oscillospiraceae bacterium]